MGEFRVVPDDDRERFREILQYAFAPHVNREGKQQDSEWPPTLFDQRGRYVDGRLVSTCKLYTLDARVRGAFLEVGGLGAVATAPEDRREGHIRHLCRDALTEYRRNSTGLVVLWPFSKAFYHDLGWGMAHSVRRYEFPPDVLPAYDVPGRMRRLDADDWKRLRRVETSHGDGIGLSLQRSEQWWRERTLSNWNGDGDPYCYGYERDGALEGYLIYTVEDEKETTLSVSNVAYTSEEAYRGLVAFLGGHGAQIEQIVLDRPVDSDLFDRIDHPERVDCQVRVGPMVRLATISALESLSWPATELDCTIEVSDPLLEATDGRFALSVAGGDLTVEAGVASDPDLSVGIATLSRLAIGALDIETAERLGRLEFEHDSIRDPLRELFTPQRVSLQEFF